MLNLIISVILFCFIVWGIPLIFIKNTKLPTPCAPEIHSTHFVITAKNAENSIEGIVRSIAWQISNKSNNSLLPTDIFILDLNSTDETFCILEKLAKEYPFIHPINKAEYIALVNNIN